MGRDLLHPCLSYSYGYRAIHTCGWLALDERDQRARAADPFCRRTCRAREQYKWWRSLEHWGLWNPQHLIPRCDIRIFFVLPFLLTRVQGFSRVQTMFVSRQGLGCDTPVATHATDSLNGNRGEGRTRWPAARWSRVPAEETTRMNPVPTHSYLQFCSGIYLCPSVCGRLLI
jgi:hypothetical protein